jgi:uncharacterized protein
MYRKVIFVVAFLGTSCALEPRSATTAEPSKRTVTVSAMAEVNVVPDQVVFTLGVTTQDPGSMAAAKAANDQKTRAVLAVLGKHGVSKDGIQITSMRMGQAYKKKIVESGGREYQTQSTEVDYFFFSRDIEVVVKQLGSVDQILEAATGAGASHGGDLLFRSTKNREMQVEARRKAVEYAKEKASHLAQLNGLKLGKALTIEEDVEWNQHTTGTGFGGMGMGGAGGSVGRKAPFDSTSLRTPSPSAKIYLTADGPKSPGNSPAKTEDADESQLLPPGIIVIDATVNITFEMLE